MSEAEKVMERTKETIASSSKLSRELADFIARGQAAQCSIDKQLEKFRESGGAEASE